MLFSMRMRFTRDGDCFDAWAFIPNEYAGRIDAMVNDMRDAAPDPIKVAVAEDYGGYWMRVARTDCAHMECAMRQSLELRALWGCGENAIYN